MNPASTGLTGLLQVSALPLASENVGNLLSLLRLHFVLSL